MRAEKSQAFLSMDPGSGKTYVVMLFLKYAETCASDAFPKVVYVVPTPWLETVARRISKDFKLLTPPVIILPQHI